MSAATTLPLMTLEEYEALPEPKGDYDYELHFGRLVKVGRANKGHYLLQEFISELLKKRLDAKKWMVGTELAYNLTEGFDARAADVAVVARGRFDRVPLDSWLTGSPELVVFIKSRSNTIAGTERAAIECLTHGAKAVWHVRYDPNTVYVYTAGGKKEYLPGTSIPLPAPMSGSIRVSGIFKRLSTPKSRSPLDQ